MDERVEEKRKEFQQKKGELISLRQQLAAAIQGKEAAFQELIALRQKIRNSLTQIRSFKAQRDELTTAVKSFKEERTKAQSALKEKTSLKTEMAQKREKLSSKDDTHESPGRVKSQIEFLERKIETEPMPFSKEKEITKKIKELKAIYNKFKHFIELKKEASTLSADVYESRKKADEFHQQVQEKAKLAQEKHESMNQLYEELKKFRSEEKNMVQKTTQLKAQTEEFRQKLDLLHKNMKELSSFFAQKEEKTFQQKVQEKTAEVSEKLKKGKKLSMDDILAFQASKE